MTYLFLAQLEWIALSFAHERNLHRDEDALLGRLQEGQLPIIEVNAVLLPEVLSAGKFSLLPRLPILDFEFVRPSIQRGDLLDHIFSAGCFEN